MTIYPDFFTMADAILAHVAATHEEILAADSPRYLLIGFCAQAEELFQGQVLEDPTEAEYARFHDDPRIFAVRVRALKGRLGVEAAGLTDSEQEAWSNYMHSTEGRMHMAEAFSRGVRLWLGNDTIPAEPPSV